LPAVLAIGLTVRTWMPTPQATAATPPTEGGPTDDFATVMSKMKAAKAGILKKHADLLAARYDLGDHSSKVKMSGGRKSVQEKVRTLLPKGMTWEQLANMSPEDIKAKGLFPAGFMPLPHPNHDEGGMLFPKFHIDEIKKQEARDLT